MSEQMSSACSGMAKASSAASATKLRTGFGEEFPPSRVSMQVKAGLLEIPAPRSS